MGSRLVFRSLTGVRVCFLRRFGGKFHQELWAGNTILLGRPSAEVGELAAFGAERTPRVAFPGGWLMADRAGHPESYHIWRRKDSAGADGIGRFGMKEAVQAVLVDLRNTEKLNPEFTVFAPPNCRRLDRDR